MIPRQCFFIYLHDDRNEMPLNINHYLCVKSQIVVNKVKAIILTNEPDSLYKFPWMIKLLNEFDEQIEIRYQSRVTNYKGNTLVNPTQESDLIRLQTLYNEGGLYCDLDVMAVSPLPQELFDSPIAIQAPEPSKLPEHGLGSAVMMAPAKSSWIGRLLSQYDEYDKNIKLGLYEQIIYKPYRLSKRYPTEVGLLDSILFYPYFYYYEDCEKLFFLDRLKGLESKESFMLHLWENRNKNVMKYLSEKYFKESNATYAQLGRRFL